MKNWKAVIAGMLALCLLILLPVPRLYAEEEENWEEQETEDPIPQSYYDPIQSNEVEGWPQGPAIESAGAVVMDMDTGALLYSKSATEKMYPASTTKIMTALLLIENCDLDEEITFSEIVYDLEEGSSHLGIQPGEKMKLKDAVYGIMLASANDISNGVAEYIGGSISGFADMMNARAAEIGCVNTHFSNPHGLYSEDHYTCAYDLALIAKTAYENPVFREITGTREYTIPKTNLVDEERSFLNHHKILQPDEEYYRDWCTGGKNGFTTECLNTLVTYAEKDGKRLVSVVLRVNGAGKAYEETSAIMEYALSNFSNTNLPEKSSRKSFYDIIGLRCLGDCMQFQSPIWMQSPVKHMDINLTLPNNAEKDEIKWELAETDGNDRRVAYTYHGYPVGFAYGVYHPIYLPAQLAFERKTEVRVKSAETGSGGSIQVESVNEVLSQAAVILENGYKIFRDYTDRHFVAVFAGGIVLLVLLIIFIIVLIFRCTSDSRIRRKRAQAEKERLKREEEIERMTTAEIEEELRAVMAQEQMRRDQEQRALAEAERAAREAREADEKAHETERLMNELEQERQQRMSSEDQGI